MALTVDESSNPIKVTGTTAAAQSITTRMLNIKGVRWVAPTTAGQVCALQNTAGKNIMHLICGADGVSEESGICFRTNGISCNDMDSGTLYIYHD